MASGLVVEPVVSRIVSVSFHDLDVEVVVSLTDGQALAFSGPAALMEQLGSAIQNSAACAQRCKKGGW